MDSIAENDNRPLFELSEKERSELLTSLFASLSPIIEESARRGYEAISHLGGNDDDWNDVGFQDLLELGRMAQQYELTIRRRKRQYKEKPGPKLPTENELEAWAMKWARFTGSQKDFAELNALSMRQMRHVIDFLKRRNNS